MFIWYKSLHCIFLAVQKYMHVSVYVCKTLLLLHMTQLFTSKALVGIDNSLKRWTTVVKLFALIHIFVPSFASAALWVLRRRCSLTWQKRASFMHKSSKASGWTLDNQRTSWQECASTSTLARLITVPSSVKPQVNESESFRISVYCIIFSQWLCLGLKNYYIKGSLSLFMQVLLATSL